MVIMMHFIGDTKGFNQKKKFNDTKILNRANEWIKSDKLYIASDSYDKILEKIKINIM